MLGRLEMSVNECIHAYQYLSQEVFQPTFYRKYLSKLMYPITRQPTYDSEQLENVIKNIIEVCGEAPEAPLENIDDRRCKV